MANYKLALASSAERQLKKLPRQAVERLVPRLESLTSNPRPGGCKKLKGGEHEWRIRVGDQRVVYTIDDGKELVDITRIRHRRNVYEHQPHGKVPDSVLVSGINQDRS